MRRGRPIGSNVRDRIVEILYAGGPMHGYEIYKVYRNIFPKITLRLVYYHLKKGVETGELKVEKVEREKGDYSWGEHAEKTYYSTGGKAKPQNLKEVKTYFDK